MNSINTNKGYMDDDLKFIPLNLQEPFSSKNSPWFPLINFNSDSYGNMRSDNKVNFTPPDSSAGINSNLVTIPQISILPEPKLNSSNPMISTDKTNNGLNNNPTTNTLENPSAVNKDELHCYGTPSSKCPPNDINNEMDTEPVHMNILRNFDFSLDSSYDTRDCYQNEVDKIFKRIKEDNGSIWGTLKAYRVPTPISSLIIKQVIKLTIKYCKELSR